MAAWPLGPLVYEAATVAGTVDFLTTASLEAVFLAPDFLATAFLTTVRPAFFAARDSKVNFCYGLPTTSRKGGIEGENFAPGSEWQLT
jgi:hypothetical protein